MLDGQETGRCRRYLGLPCPLRFHEDWWRPMAVVKRVWGLGLKSDVLGGEDGRPHCNLGLGSLNNFGIVRTLTGCYG